MSIENEYLAQLEEMRPQVQELWLQHDSIIISALFEEGWNTDQVKKGILACSQVVKNQPREFVDHYLDSIEHRLNVKEISTIEGDIKKSYAVHSKNHFIDIVQFYTNNDVRIASLLCAKGYDVSEIQDTLLKHGRLTSTCNDKDFNQNYVDFIMKSVDTMTIKIVTEEDKVLALNDYLASVERLQEKYTQPFREFQDGKVLLDLIINKGYSADAFVGIVGEHTPNQIATENYEKNLLKKCNDVKLAYFDIIATDEKTHPSTTEGKYKVYTLRYMLSTGTSILNGRDEQKIIARLLDEGIPVTEIKDTLLTHSPVAKEPGRNPTNYVNTCITVAQDKLLKKKEFIAAHYNDVATSYTTILQDVQAALEARSEEFRNGVDKNRAYYDGIVAKSLLQENHHPLNIMKVIADHSPLAQAPSGNNPNKTPEGYGKFIVSAVQRQLAAEKAITGFVLEDQQTSKLSPTGLYRLIVKEYVEMYPSAIQSLSQPFIDKDAVEKMLARGINEDTISKALQEASPRAQMPGITPDYGRTVVEHTMARVSAALEKSAREISLRDEYLKQCGLTIEGITHAQKEFSSYHDGRAAVKMLENGVAKEEIRDIIAKETPRMPFLQAHGTDPYKYAHAIVCESEKVLLRTNAVRAYIPPENAVDLKDLYQSRLQEVQKDKPISSRDDIAITADLLAAGHDKENLQAAIQTYSPIAVEPGRGDGYTKYVVARANEILERRQKLLERYQPIPRLNKIDLATDEYQHHIDIFQGKGLGDLTPEIDRRIAKTMLLQSYTAKEIEAAISQYSPCGLSLSIDTKKHAKSVMKEASKEYKTEKKKALGPERSLTK